jgi:hypothetical protein
MLSIAALKSADTADDAGDEALLLPSFLDFFILSATEAHSHNRQYSSLPLRMIFSAFRRWCPLIVRQQVMALDFAIMAKQSSVEWKTL